MTERLKILAGDVRQTLAQLPPNSVHCAMTSPPYWALRSYLPANHELKPLELGSEKTPEAFIANLLAVFREVRRVLRDDGTLWVNLGESYANGPSGRIGDGYKQSSSCGTDGNVRSVDKMVEGLIAGNRAGIPNRFALAMQADGWIWRDEIQWCKPSPMPMSFTGWQWQRCRVKVGRLDGTKTKQHTRRC
jgi:DNA modification methylase